MSQPSCSPSIRSTDGVWRTSSRSSTPPRSSRPGATRAAGLAEQFQQLLREGRRGRHVLVPEVDVYGLGHGANARCERLVRRLAPAEVAERRRMVEVVHPYGASFREPLLDAVPRRMLQVECDPESGPERTEDELDRAFVAHALQRDAYRPEPLAECACPGVEGLEAAGPVSGQLRRELEAVRRLLRPAAELLHARHAIAGRVQLDRPEVLRVEAEERLRVEPGRIEPGPPGRIRPAGRSD